jgi:hypothetical protein
MSVKSRLRNAGLGDDPVDADRVYPVAAKESVSRQEESFAGFPGSRHLVGSVFWWRNRNHP